MARRGRRGAAPPMALPGKGQAPGIRGPPAPAVACSPFLSGAGRRSAGPSGGKLPRYHSPRP